MCCRGEKERGWPPIVSLEDVRRGVALR
jgi:hypothetical protein